MLKRIVKRTLTLVLIIAVVSIALLCYSFVPADLTWAIEGVKLPAERPWISRKLVDLDEVQVRRSIVKVHQLLERRPELVIVPAHDRRIHDQLANFPEVER
jgi:hypothetical protein